jgi:DNA-binding GntR family transcriptional regulator
MKARGASVLGEDLYARLRRAILNCTLAPGASVYEGELAEQYAVSKSPVRDALTRLRVEGLVQVEPRRGYRIAPISLADVREMYAMRLIYERASLAAVIEHATDAAIATLRPYARDRKVRDLRLWITENFAFHTRLAELSGVRRLHQSTQRLLEESERVIHMGLAAQHDLAPLPRFVQAHAEIIEAIAARDKRRALALVTAHIEGSRERALRSLGQLPVVA